MSFSNSSLNTFASCMKKYDLIYNEHKQPDKPNIHLQFGTMAHECLYNAGRLRDDAADGVVDEGEFYKVIPSEVLYADLKQAFHIYSWNNYFMSAIKQIYEYEHSIVEEYKKYGDVTIKRELKLQVTPEQINNTTFHNIHEPFVGVIDLLVMAGEHAIILDYKFSSSRKTQDDFDLNSQLYMYAYLVHVNYKIPYYNIEVGYIDIPKQSFEVPVVLSNGKLSKSKSQNCSQELYKMAVEAVHEDDPYYNCEPGGYYYEAWCSFANNKSAYLSRQFLDLNIAPQVLEDLVDTAETITTMNEHHMPYLRKYDSYSCKSCEYLKYCKPYLTEVW